MNETIEFLTDRELAKDIEVFFTERGIKFEKDEFVRASDPLHTEKPPGKWLTIVDTTIKEVAKVFSQYLDSRGITIEFKSKTDTTLILDKKDSPEKAEAFFHEHKDKRITLNIKL